ncbi:MAG: response regulator [Deltaproteobacteria bacterium]|nr:MAG: response regulator [Deltaproteobacteria bacterium]
MDPSGALFVDDEPENVQILVDILSDVVDGPVMIATTVTEAVERLHEHNFLLVVMDVFIPLGDHPNRVLGPRAARLQDKVDHLGGLVLLEEIDRLVDRPKVLAHTACTDHALLEIFSGRVEARIPKPAPIDTALRDVLEVLRR